MNSPQPPPLPSLGAALEWARRELAQIESGSLIAQVGLAYLCRQPRSWILAHPENNFPQNLSAEFASFIRRARNGEPLAYLTGVQEFFGLEFEVSPEVLIPRPETELLVSTALEWLSHRRKELGQPSSEVRVVDLGTGSGCIAASLAVHTGGLRVIAADRSSGALQVAARNMIRLGIRDRIRLLQADLLAPLHGPIDLLCANLPYALAPSLAGSPVIRFEPRRAVDGGPDGLRLIAHAIEQSAKQMAGNGLALFEIDASHAGKAQELAERHFQHGSVSVMKDLAGLDRLLIVRT